MLPTRGFAVKGPDSSFQPFSFERRDPGPRDVVIKILYCGVCHTDIHLSRNDSGRSRFPMVPGHEIVGRVSQVGSNVTRFKVGDIAGVGCFVDSCRACPSCEDGIEQYCNSPLVLTYNGLEKDRKTPTYGGYSSQIVVDENYTLQISSSLSLPNVAPLLCAGVTTYSPLRHFNAGPGQQVAVVGLGGLGHMAVKLAASMGAEVTVISTSPSKEEDARRLGAHNFLLSTQSDNFKTSANRFHLIIDAVSAPHDLNLYVNLLRRDGTLVLLGIPPIPAALQAFPLIAKRRRVAGSLIGGIRETQEMLDYCARKDISSDVEVIAIQQIEKAYERTIKGDVRYRFVIDLETL
jgi:alcohol dehydrogenase (NADP+)